MLIDTHCHLFYPDLKNDLPAVIDRAAELGVERMICVGTNLSDSRECLELADKFACIFATAGVHPHDAKDAPPDFITQLEELLDHPKMVAVGEMGLDFYRNISAAKIQERVFRAQLELAQSIDKPIIFHNRDADGDMLRILREAGSGTGVAHCFSSDLPTAKAFLKLGYYISFSGNLTFKKSHLLEIVKWMPLEKLLVETDSPYLSPVPFRGKPNEPGRVRYVAEKLADILGLSWELMATHTTDNAQRLFNLLA